MTPQETVLATCRVEKLNRVSVYDSFWPESEEAWRQEKGPIASSETTDYYRMDVENVIPDETPFPSRAGPAVSAVRARAEPLAIGEGAR